MNPWNPYAAPSADTFFVPDPPGERSLWNLPWLLFSFEGRIPRRAWWGGHALATVALYVAVTPVLLVAGDSDALLTALMLLLYVPYFWVLLALSAKRWHDLGHSGWWSLLMLLPFGGLFVWVFCGGLRGNEGTNAFGRDLT